MIVKPLYLVNKSPVRHVHLVCHFEGFSLKPSTDSRLPGKHRNLSISRSKSNLRQGSRGAISPMMISAPSPQSFIHVAHVGINNNGVIETTEGVDPSWKTVLSGLQSIRMESSMVAADRREANFIDGFWKGADPRMGSNNSSETTIVETPSNDSKVFQLWSRPCDLNCIFLFCSLEVHSNPKIRYRMPSNATFAAY